MALFGNKKKTEKKEAAAVVATPSTSGSNQLAHILTHARITEKASMLQAQNVYTFNVASSATKRDIMQAVKAVYNVLPIKVAVINEASKEKRNARTGRSAMAHGGKKAYVYLKAGDTITL
ncbi:MAG: ribosomal protein [Candidatus Kaiserbacteria bacterium]|nr:ribosomal protein [Candidatus Kaiserbacteria bacterium]